MSINFPNLFNLFVLRNDEQNVPLFCRVWAWFLDLQYQIDFTLYSYLLVTQCSEQTNSYGSRTVVLLLDTRRIIITVFMFRKAVTLVNLRYGTVVMKSSLSDTIRLYFDV